MGFKRINYGTGEEIFRLDVEDGTGKKIEKWKVMKSDALSMFDIVKRKFGLTKKESEDLDWLK
jgi:hypothetical protein